MILTAEAAEKWYFRQNGYSNRFYAVTQTDLSLLPGTVTVLTGRSGSGKTTLLHMMAGLLRPDGGKVLSDGKDLYAMNDRELSFFRNRHLGLIPQGHLAVKTLTVKENVMFSCLMYGKGAVMDRSSAEKESKELMEQFGIAHLAEVFPGELSGGELRRMSVARALLGRPDVILADEPTGDLDDENTLLVMEAFKEAAKNGAAVLLATHETEAVKYASVLYRMESGKMTKVE